MKTFSRWFVFAALAVSLPALAVNLPMRIPFQGKLIDPTGNNPKNGDIVMTFRIYDVPTGGTARYTEPMTVAVTNGVFAVQIGTSALLSTDLFSHASAYLGVTVSGDTEMLPRQPLTMSAYAFTSMQLASPVDIRVNSGTAYSTFTSAGNWEMPYGITAGSGTITGNSFAVGTSSFVVAGGSATVGYRLTAGSFSGDGADLTKTRPQISTFIANGGLATAAATEIVISSVPINPSRTDSLIQVLAQALLVRSANSVSNWTLRIRRSTPGVCTATSLPIVAQSSSTVANVAGTTAQGTLMAVDAPGSTATQWYCMTALSNTAHAVSSRTIIVSEFR